MGRRLNVAIIGQGRSGRDIHGRFFRSEANVHFDVKYVVEWDAERRERAEKEYPGCVALKEYTELFDKKDVDLVVNASYSDLHYAITKDLLEHKFNVLTEKPFGATQYECEVQINAAKKNGVVLAVFQNSQRAPYYLHALKVMKEGVLGDVKQVSIRFNGFARRWDWQTLQKRVAGSAYNTGPHPIAMALGFLDFDENYRVAYSKLDRALTSGDAEDYVKIILTAPGKPVVDIEINSTDAFSDYTLKLQGSRGTMKSSIGKYEMKYFLTEENPQREVIETSLKNENGEPMYCGETLKMHEESGEYDGNPFTKGTWDIYNNVYDAIVNGAELLVDPIHSAMTINVIATAHAANPLPVKY